MIINTCVVIGTSMWLSFNSGYQPTYINIANISTIFENGGRGEVDVTDSHDNRHYVWSDELNRYLHRDEIFAIIQACPVPK